ncbi:MAG: hypothetical protein CUN56_05025 [Phototrophicales bacterium]|nr:MAG: hypothetical protein CUN56_05025 [Phototrophicales bacterium]
MPKRAIVPNLVLAQRVIDKMCVAANTYIEDETGEAMVGLVDPGKNTNGVPTIYVLDTIAPDDTAERQYAKFEQGDHRQDEIIWWYHQNWNVQRARKNIPSKWDLPLKYLGDWHRQPGYMIAPSGADLMTALDILNDEERAQDFLLAPIVTLHHPTTTTGGEGMVNYLTVAQNQDEATRIDFWYIDKELRMFVPIVPTLYADTHLPRLAAHPWHLLHPDRASVELTRLNNDGLFASFITWDADNELPLEICLMLARQGDNKMLILVTDWDYPKRAPRAYSTPFVSMQEDEVLYDVFERVWQQRQPININFDWTTDSYLIDYVHAIEAQKTQKDED